MTKALDSALRLLTQREHSAYELSIKLKQKGFAAEDIRNAISSCQQSKVQSDQRFVEQYVRMRVGRGYGPVKISQELAAKGIDSTLIAKSIDQDREYWIRHALKVWEKKCRGQTHLSFLELQKQQRFLLSRGFEMDVITQLVKEWT
jgi:regulatory protein